MTIKNSLILKPLIVGLFTIAIAAVPLQSAYSAVSSSLDNEAKTEIAFVISNYLVSARAVISDEQSHINNPGIGDKQLSGSKIVALSKAMYQKITGQTLPADDGDSDLAFAVRSMSAAIKKVMDLSQSHINKQGLGFKTFLPAIFARQVAVKFNVLTHNRVKVKLTAPREYVRNSKNLPDGWENSIIDRQFKSAQYKKGEPHTEAKTRKGYRFIMPEYYQESCLSCHGAPKGEADITGGLKEGGKLGELGGAISITIR